MHTSNSINRAQIRVNDASISLTLENNDISSTAHEVSVSTAVHRRTESHKFREVETKMPLIRDRPVATESQVSSIDKASSYQVASSISVNSFISNNRVLVNKESKTNRRTYDNNLSTNESENNNIYTHELAIVEPVVADDSYINNINKWVKTGMLKLLEITNQCLKKFGADQEVIMLKDVDGMADLARGCAKGYYRISELGYSDFFSAQHNKMNTAFQLEMRNQIDFQTDTLLNVMIYLNVFNLLFQKYYEYREPRKLISQIKFSEDLEDVVLPKINIGFSSVIKKLEEFKDSHYFSMLLPMMDSSKDVRSKLIPWCSYLNMKINLEDTRVLFAFFESIMYFPIKNMLSYLTYIQILLDCLRDIEKAPKTQDNILIAFRICDLCTEFFTEDVEDLKSSGIINVPYGKNFLVITHFLKKFRDKLREAITSKADKIIEVDDRPIVVTRKLKKGRKKRRNKNKGHTPGINESSKNPKSEECKKMKDTNSALTETKIIDIESCAKKSDEDSLDAIERETNELMEVFRQFIERDRKEKLGRKEAAAQLKLTTITQEQTVVLEKPSAIKLSNKHQRTLKMLFHNAFSDVEIQGADIESLIKILGGRIQGDGNGSRFKIFWGNSNKQAGVYEIFHGKDQSGCLSSQSVFHVSEAINVGVSRGFIAESTISQALI